MPSYYSIIQYHPDSIIGECINIGCIALDMAMLPNGDVAVIHHRFLKDWERVKAFGGKEIQFLLDFAKDFEDADRPITRQQVDRFLNSDYPTSIQFTPLRGSLLTAKELIEETAKRFLVEPKKENPEIAKGKERNR